MTLVSKKDFAKAAGLDRWGIFSSPLAGLMMRLMGIHKINKVYSEIGHLEGDEFLDKLLKKLGVSYHVFEEDLARIPRTGAFIVVANHPLGAIDGLIMLQVISKIRPDFKTLSNFILRQVKPLEKKIIAVNPFTDKKELYSSVSGMRAALAHLKEERCLGIFPAGEVSNKNNPQRIVKDKEWESVALKLIKKAGVPVIPMYFHAKNSRLFYKISSFSPLLQTAMLPSEMLRKRKNAIKFRIGKSIPAKRLSKFESLPELENYLKKRVYMLRTFYHARKSFLDKFNFTEKLIGKKTVSQIADETPPNLISQEITHLRNLGKCLFSSANYEVFFSDSKLMPNVLREIGRLREILFRSIGEGTNSPLDLDEFDNHYHHLFLWDSVEEKIVGAYRIALGSTFYDRLGVNGFYNHTLFKIGSRLHPFLSKTIEMSRAFVVQEYQQKSVPLTLLWKGIVFVCLKHPEHKFLMGIIGLSDDFSEVSKYLMVEFMRENYYDSLVAQHIRPKIEFKTKLKDSDISLFSSDIKVDLNEFDRLIGHIEPSLRVPPLMKKYIKENAKVVAFNVDPNFNNSVDAMMYIKIRNLPESTINSVFDELSALSHEENLDKNLQNK